MTSMTDMINMAAAMTNTEAVVISMVEVTSTINMTVQSMTSMAAQITINTISMTSMINTRNSRATTSTTARTRAHRRGTGCRAPITHDVHMQFMINYLRINEFNFMAI